MNKYPTWQVVAMVVGIVFSGIGIVAGIGVWKASQQVEKPPLPADSEES